MYLSQPEHQIRASPIVAPGFARPTRPGLRRHPPTSSTPIPTPSPCPRRITLPKTAQLPSPSAVDLRLPPPPTGAPLPTLAGAVARSSPPPRALPLTHSPPTSPSATLPHASLPGVTRTRPRGHAVERRHLDHRRHADSSPSTYLRASSPKVWSERRG